MEIKPYIDAVKKYAKQDIAHVRPSFEQAYEGGHYKELGLKVGSVAVGAMLTAKGVEQFAKGSTERVPGTQDPTDTQPNYVRMFVGSFTTFAGAAMLYFGTCKSILAAR